MAGQHRFPVVVFYHGATGAIVHVHYGRAAQPRVALEREARAYAAPSARRRGVPARRLLRLHSDSRTFRPDRAYTVDVKRRRLIAQPRRAERRG